MKEPLKPWHRPDDRRWILLSATVFFKEQTSHIYYGQTEIYCAISAFDLFVSF